MYMPMKNHEKIIFELPNIKIKIPDQALNRSNPLKLSTEGRIYSKVMPIANYSHSCMADGSPIRSRFMFHASLCRIRLRICTGGTMIVRLDIHHRHGYVVSRNQSYNRSAVCFGPRSRATYTIEEKESQGILFVETYDIEYP